jgi:dihydroxyacetone kinase-like protein
VSEVEIMPMHVDVQCMRAMLRVVIERLRAAEDELAALDAATGDGDHGAAMGKVASRIEACLDDAAHETPGALLEASGWSVMSIDAGSTGTLYGSWLLGFGEGCGASDTLDGSGLARGLDGSLTRLGTVTQAAVGDKTLIDALAPAVEAAKAAASEGLAPGVVMERVSRRSRARRRRHGRHAGEVRPGPQHRRAVARSRRSRGRLHVHLSSRDEGGTRRCLMQPATWTARSSASASRPSRVRSRSRARTTTTGA